METLTQAPKKQKPRWLLWLMVGITVLLAGSFLVCCLLARYSSTICPRLQVGDIPLGGMTYEEAERTLKTAPLIRQGWSSEYTEAERLSLSPEIEIWIEDEQVALWSDTEIGLSWDTVASAERAMQWTREDGFCKNGYLYLQTVLKGISLAPCWQAEEELCRAKIAELAEQVNRPTQEVSWVIKGESLLVTLPRDGCIVQQEALLTAIQEELQEQGATSYDCPLTIYPAQAITVEGLSAQVEGEAKNACYDATTQTIVSEQLGVRFDHATAEALLRKGKGTVSIPVTLTQPDITATQLKKELFQDVLGSCTTYVGGSAERLNNVRLAAKAINGVILNSGEVFDYNSTLGQRTEARGYQKAPAYVKGETVETLGGGICQVSSNLYRATVLSNLEIVSRQNHGYVSSYIGKGFDATVSWGGPEFRFRNDTAYPVKISSSWSGRNLTVSLIGSNPEGIRVEFLNEVISTTPYQEIEEKTDTLPLGKRQEKVSPYTGYKVNTYRKVYDKDGNLISEKLEAVNVYRTRNRVTLVGTKEEPIQPVTPTQTPTEPIDPTPSVEMPEEPSTTTETPLPQTEAPVEMETVENLQEA